MGYAVVFVLVGHVLADFYAQTDRIARDKRADVRDLALHCVLYALCVAPFCLLAFPLPQAAGVWVVLGFTHAAIDVCKTAWERRNAPAFAAFCLDQALHAIVCVAVSAALFGGFPVLDVVPALYAVMGAESFDAALAAALVLLVVGRPAAVFVRLLLGSVRAGRAASEEPAEADEELRAGRWIGILERTVIAVLTLCGQFEAIAFVLTAKSIARFKMLDDREFAECYLVGTLASTAVAILASLAIREVVGWS